MKLRYKTKRTNKVKGHDHVALLDAKGNGKTLKHGMNHVHTVKNDVIVEEKEHIHTFIE